MTRSWPAAALLLSSFVWSGCGNDARFGGGQSRANARNGSENAEGDPALDPTARADAADGQDGGTDAAPGSDGDGREGGETDGGTQGQDGGERPIDVPETQSLYWHWPCTEKPAPATPSDPQAMVITGAGEYLLEQKNLTLEVQGAACDPAKGPRDVLFLVDVSDSMRNFLNLGNDPVKNDTCGRSEAVKKVLGMLNADARVALVTFDGNAQAVSDGYLEVAAFRDQYVKTAILCKAGANTNFTKAFTAAQATLLKGRTGAAKELYLLSDGEPNSSDVDGHAEAAAIKQGATIATLMLKGDEDYMRDVLASKDATGQPLHAKVEKAVDLAEAMGKLAEVELKEAFAQYGAVGDEANWKEQALAAPDELGFLLESWMLKPTAWPTGFGFRLKTIDSKGVVTDQLGKLLWKP